MQNYLSELTCYNKSYVVFKIRRAPTRHNNMDFRQIITRISEILPLSAVTADKGYDSEDNHLLVRENLHAFSVIPARYEHVRIWRTRGKSMKADETWLFQIAVQSTKQG